MAYPTYKKCTIQTQENSIPSHWNFLYGSGCFVENKEKYIPNTQPTILQFNYGKIVPKAIQNVWDDDIAVYEKYTHVVPDTIMINGLNLNYDFVSQRVGIVKEEGIITSAYISMNCRSAYDKDYAVYLLKSIDDKKIFHGMGTGIRLTLSFSDIKKMQFPVPPLQEQQQIVRYLDWKTSQINHLIHGYERLISLLEERKTAVINEAVTKGIHMGVAMKDSGVDWIGEMPAHWNLERVRQFFHIKKDIAGTEGYDVLSITQSGIKKKDIASNEGQMANDYSNYQFVNPGEYAMNHMDLLTGYIGLSPYFGVTSPDYRVFAINDVEMCDSEYYLKVFQIGYRRHIFFKFGHGAASKGRWRLPAKEFLNYVIPVPPIQEQKEIAAHIADEIGKLDTIIERITKETELLRERRTRLISDVVTGAFDVRGIEVPEYTPEQDMEVTEDGDEYEGERA